MLEDEEGERDARRRKPTDRELAVPSDAPIPSEPMGTPERGIERRGPRSPGPSSRGSSSPGSSRSSSPPPSERLLRVDRSAFPLVVLTPGRADDTEVDGYLALLDELAAGARDAVVLVDLRLCLAISPLVRRRVAEAFGERGEAWTKRGLAQAFVAATPAQRGAVTAVQWMIEGAPDCPIFEDRADAEAFLKSVLEPPSE